MNRYLAAAVLFVTLFVGSLAGGIALQVRSVHCRRFVDAAGGSNLECRVAWRSR